MLKVRDIIEMRPPQLVIKYQLVSLWIIYIQVTIKAVSMLCSIFAHITHMQTHTHNQRKTAYFWMVVMRGILEGLEVG